MIDYRGIEALYMVLELQSFEAAAKKLHITQSAVSQRIKGLETHFGEPVLIRNLPYTLTRLGETLVGHYQRISILEKDLEKQISTSYEKPRISIAINRDSLETWFLELMKNKLIFENVLLEVVADDQELTLEYFKKGLVSACLSTSKKTTPEGESVFLGDMEYLLVCSPDFKDKYFSKRDVIKSLLAAPAVKFDKNDFLHEKYLEKYFSLKNAELNFHLIPSVQGFKRYALLGYGYCLIPKIDIVQELKKGELVQIFKDKTWKVPFYWHYWTLESKVYQKFNRDVIRQVKKMLGL